MIGIPMKSSFYACCYFTPRARLEYYQKLLYRKFTLSYPSLFPGAIAKFAVTVVNTVQGI